MAASRRMNVDDALEQVFTAGSDDSDESESDESIPGEIEIFSEPSSESDEAADDDVNEPSTSDDRRGGRRPRRNQTQKGKQAKRARITTDNDWNRETFQPPKVNNFTGNSGVQADK